MERNMQKSEKVNKYNTFTELANDNTFAIKISIVDRCSVLTKALYSYTHIGCARFTFDVLFH